MCVIDWFKCSILQEMRKLWSNLLHVSYYATRRVARL